ncbi:MAG TPA: amidohydrolase family protein, partial [Candidatus Baltobacteraceae bacterium]|nr:amidohydrolase family protein [Candidatus Baltobacteraceae bacterium]
FSIKALGIENVLWAIDYPYQPTTPAVAFMDSAPVSDAEKHALYHGNAERVFHIASAGVAHSHAGATSAARQ